MTALMFPEAPAPTVSITLVENTDLHCHLVEFPNHLIIHTVMEHFCAPSGRQPTNRGYIAKEMAQRLSVHKKAVNSFDVDTADRTDNLLNLNQRAEAVCQSARRRKQAAGQTVELASFEGQCLGPGLEEEENEDKADDGENSGAPTEAEG